MKPLPNRFVRSFSIAVPLITALFFFGIITELFNITKDSILFHTGISLGFLFGILNTILVWIIWKRRLR